MTRRIVASGGSGFSTDQGPEPDDHLLGLAGVARPRVLFVPTASGGSTADLLAVWRRHGLDAVLREAYAAGVVLAGISAGMNCWFAASVTDSFGPTLSGLDDGLGLLPGSARPHDDSEPRRRPVYRDLVAGGSLGGYAAPPAGVPRVLRLDDRPRRSAARPVASHRLPRLHAPGASLR